MNGSTNTSLSALNEFMFSQLEALTNSDLTAEEAETERKKAESMAKIGKIIIESASLSLDAYKMISQNGLADVSDEVVHLLGVGK